MSLTDRDKKIIFLLVPLLVAAGYWFLILAPKRKEASQVSQQLVEAQGKRDTAQSQLSHLMVAKNSFAGSFLSEAEKAAHIAAIDVYASNTKYSSISN